MHTSLFLFPLVQYVSTFDLPKQAAWAKHNLPCRQMNDGGKTTQLVIAERYLTLIGEELEEEHSQKRQKTEKKIFEKGSRRNLLALSVVGGVAALTSPTLALAVAEEESVAQLVASLKAARDLLVPLSGKLQDEQWDAVRSVLKGPGLGELWNLGASKNPINKLAKATDSMELIELSDELQVSLQMADQLTYDNAFVYFQPGSGKIDLKGPQNMIKRSMEQLDEIIQAASDKSS